MPSFDGCTYGDFEDEHEVVYDRSSHSREEALRETSELWGVAIDELRVRSARARMLSHEEQWRCSYAYLEYAEWREDHDLFHLPIKRPDSPPEDWDPMGDEYQSVWRFAKWYERGTRIWLVGTVDDD